MLTLETRKRGRKGERKITFWAEQHKKKKDRQKDVAKEGHILTFLDQPPFSKIPPFKMSPPFIQLSEKQKYWITLATNLYIISILKVS